MPRSLLERFAELTDPRSRHGRHYPLPSLLGLLVVGFLAGHKSLAAIAHFGRLRGHKLGHALGFKDGQMPCANTFTNAIAKLDADHLDRILGEYLLDRHDNGWQHVALDGKVIKGSRDGEVPGVHLLAAYVPQASAVIAQMRVEATTNEHKASLQLLGILPSLAGKVVTADAMFTHVDVCEKVLEKQGEYILYAKDNQKQLKEDIELMFTSAERGDFSPSRASRVGA
jgi:DDE_Tnp_1-associated/Transposase DDE domain